MSTDPMNPDFLRQWQALAAMLDPTGGGYGVGSAGFAPAAAMFAPGGAMFGALGASAGSGPEASFGSYAESTERFGKELKRFLDAAAAGGQVASAAIQALSDALRERFADYFPALRGAGAGPSHATASDTGSGSPALGLTREHQQRWRRVVGAWNRMMEAQRRLQRLWSDALREAAGVFAQRLGASKPSMPDAEGLRRLYDQWIDCAEDAYARVAHSEAFCDALSEFINAGSEWREALKESVAAWSKWLDLPTRAELNSLLQRLRTVEQPMSADGRPRSSPRSRPKRKREATSSASRPLLKPLKARKARSAKPARPLHASRGRARRLRS